MTNYKKSLLAALLCAASVTFAGCDKDNGPEKTCLCARGNFNGSGESL